MIKKNHIYGAIIVLLIAITSLIFWVYEKEAIGPSAQLGSRMITQNIDALSYVGREACIDCHKKEYELWQNSDHDRSMQIADEKTVLGNFENSSFTHYGVTSRFYKRDGKFYVHTEGDDGKLHDYQVKYTFGVIPLQQYLVEFDDGRVQTLPFCWDTRPKAKGGKHWFHIYPDEHITPKDILFWTRMNQNWNYMCAECHSTNLKKNYDYDTGQYRSTFSEIDVSCEMCHGRGSAHVEWAKLYEKEKRVAVKGDMGLQVRLKDPNNGTWIFTDMEKGTAERTVELNSKNQIETCALCHSRRSALTDNYLHGRILLDSHRIPPLDKALYFADGQILEEVYVYGSFLQSKMHQKGVVCSDCHEPHSAKVYSNNNSLCFRCHLPQKYDVKSHHFHKPDSTGGSCVDCHMPERKYMVVDPRRDHSIRIPRPDLSKKLETPNACNQCHQDKLTQWATEYIVNWYGKKFTQRPHYGEVIYAAQKGHPQAGPLLHQLITDENQSNMVKATAISLLGSYPGAETTEILRSMLYDQDPLLRLMAVDALDSLDPSDRFIIAKHLLQDPVKAVRLRSAFILSEVSREAMTGFDRAIFDPALSEFIESQLYNADRPSAHINLGVIYLRQGDLKRAEEAYKKAISIEPAYAYSYINLSDLYREQGRDAEGEVLIREAIAYIPGSADLYHAYGLLLTRQKKRSEALSAFEKAANLRPDDVRLQYYWALAVMESGQTEQSIKILEEAYNKDPSNTEILYALATICRDNDKLNSAVKYSQRLYELVPENRMYLQLHTQIKQMVEDSN